MEIICEIIVRHDELAPEFYRELRSKFPEGGSRGVFMSRLPLGHPRNEEILQFLSSAGMTIPASYTRKRLKGEVQLAYDIQYTLEDFESSELLEPWPELTVAYFTERSPKGVLRIKTGYMRPFRFAHAGSELAVSSNFRTALEKVGFKHLRFDRTVIFGDGSEKFEDPVWEFSSDLVLPPVASTCRFSDEDGNPVKDPAKGRLIQEGLYVPTEFHYTRSSLRKLGDFDAARVREGIGPYYRDHPVIVSNRFYQFCVKQKLKMGWIPVRIDPD